MSRYSNGWAKLFILNLLHPDLSKSVSSIVGVRLIFIIYHLTAISSDFSKASDKQDVHLILLKFRIPHESFTELVYRNVLLDVGSELILISANKAFSF